MNTSISRICRALLVAGAAACAGNKGEPSSLPLRAIGIGEDPLAGKPGPHAEHAGIQSAASIACTAASPYLSAALSDGQQALPYAQADYNNNAEYSAYPQEDVIGTQQVIQGAQGALTFDLNPCANISYAAYDAQLAANGANYAMAGEQLVFNMYPYNGYDTADPYSAFQLNAAANNNLAVALQVFGNCTCTPPPPSFSASPNPVQVPYGVSTGTTTISWNAPYRSSMSIYVSQDGAAQSPFAGGGSSGSASAPWIQPAHRYAFYLYDSSNLSAALASVVVTATQDARPTITASPTTVQIPYPKSTGSTTLNWNAPGYGAVSVYVSEDGAAQSLMSSGGTTGSVMPTWIAAGHRYLFSLYPTGNTNLLLSSVTVTGKALPTPTMTASSNPVVVPYGTSTGSWTLTWNAPGYSQVDLYGVQNLQNPGQKLFLGTGPTSGSAAEPMSVGEKATLWLYPHGDTSTLLATLQLSGVQGAAPTMTASPNPVIVPANLTSTTFTLTWSAPGRGQVDLWGQQNLQNPGQKLFLGSGPESGTAQEPVTVGEVATLWLYAHGDTTNPLAIVQISARH